VARFKKKVTTVSRAWFIAAMGMVAVGTLAGYTLGGFLAPKPVACEPNEHAMGAYRSEAGIQKFRLEDCEDGTKRMVPDGFIHLRDGAPSEPQSEGPKTEL
jgi:hypothetical protein